MFQVLPSVQEAQMGQPKAISWQAIGVRSYSRFNMVSADLTVTLCVFVFKHMDDGKNWMICLTMNLHVLAAHSVPTVQPYENLK